MVRAGLIGFGYWGPNLARNFSDNSRIALTKIADRSPQRREAASARYRNAAIVEDGEGICDDPDIDVVVIATPAATHYALALRALKAGKHLFVAKPLTLSSADAKELTDVAAASRKILMVDHTYTFTGAAQSIKSTLDAGALGDLDHYDSTRINLGLLQPDTNVIWDLASHDVSLLDFFLGKLPVEVSAHGARFLSDKFEEVAYVTLRYSDRCLAHLNVSWLSPVKIRRTVLGGSKKMLVWNDLDPDERIKIYDKGIELNPDGERYRLQASYRVGNMISPVVPDHEALREEVGYFLRCIERQEQPLNGGESAQRVIAVIEAVQRSLAANGAMVPVSLNG